MTLKLLYQAILDLNILIIPFTPFFKQIFISEFTSKYEITYKDKNEVDKTLFIPSKNNSVRFLCLRTFNQESINNKEVKYREKLQMIVKYGRNLRQKRKISLQTKVKTLYVILCHADNNLIFKKKIDYANYIRSSAVKI